MRHSIWLDVIGPEYIDLAFRWAHEADPAAKLYYNDYDIESPGPKARAVTRLVHGLQARGVPIDGVGIQAHELTVRSAFATRPRGRAARVRGAWPSTSRSPSSTSASRSPPTSEARRAGRASTATCSHACLAVPRCRTFVTWGFTDRSLVGARRVPGFGDALPFDRDYRPKPAVGALRSGLARGRG